MLYDKNLSRRSVSGLIGGAYTVDVAECGTEFLVDATTAAYSITLPTAANAGAGWYCKFTVNAATAGNEIKIVPGDGNNSMATNFFEPNTMDSDEASNNIAFESGAIRGNWIEVFTDGSFWYAYGLSGTNGAISDDQ